MSTSTQLKLRKLISGGQTGADRAGLDFAISHGFIHGGKCPKGRLAEDGPIPNTYALTETSTYKYPQRTKLNVEESNATLVIIGESKITRGSKLTVDHARKVGKPCHVVFASGGTEPTAEQVAETRAWLETVNPLVLNVAGSRGSSAPNVGPFTQALLAAVLLPGT